MGGGYSEIQKRNDIAVYDAPIFADIQINRFSLHITSEQNDKDIKRVHNRLFHVHDGKVEDYVIVDGNMSSTEYLYAHFQQRKLEFESDLRRNNYLIVPPNKAISMKNCLFGPETIKKLTTGNILSWNIKGQMKRMIHLIYCNI